MREASWVVIDRSRTDPKRLSELYPAMRDTQPPETREFERALESNFKLVKRDGAFELRHRREGISDAICNGIGGS